MPGIPLVLLVLLTLLLGGCGGNGVECPAPEDTDSERTAFTIQPWKNGFIPYKFSEDADVALPDDPERDDRDIVREMMAEWEDAFKLDDPAAPGNFTYLLDFGECADPCPYTDTLLIRYNQGNETNNMCDGVLEDGDAVLHFKAHVGGNLDDTTVLHELGHCLGLWHDQNSADRDAWLLEDDGFCYDYDERNGPDHICSQNMPILGNYDYDSVMHYPSYDPSFHTRRHRDLLENAFSMWELNLGTGNGEAISPRIRSRLLQYYAHDHNANWGFFESLSRPPPSASTDALRDPYLDHSPVITAVGTPAIAVQSPGNYDIFARGTNNRLYWMAIRGSSRSRWTSLGCCFGSDPAAISRRDGEIDVVAIGADTGRLVMTHYANGEWGGWTYVRADDPQKGIKKASDEGYIGPAIASRGQETLDVFVVQGDGLLAVTTLEDETWSAWGTLGRGYNVTARPAAVALSETTVKLAVNERGMYLYEGALKFSPATPAFGLTRMAIMAYETPPALAARDDPDNPYRIFIANGDGRISHRFANGAWRDIGGIPKSGTGPAAVATGRSGVAIVINGEDATGCDLTCMPGEDPEPDGEVIQPGGLWLRIFD